METYHGQERRDISTRPVIGDIVEVNFIYKDGTPTIAGIVAKTWGKFLGANNKGVAIVQTEVQEHTLDPAPNIGTGRFLARDEMIEIKKVNPNQ